MNVAWCITGGGAGIRAVARVLKSLSQRLDVNVTLFLTRWGYEVARMFGVLDVLKLVAPGGYYREFLVGDQGMYYVGRLNLGRYALLVIAPATSNTIAKIVAGIADSIASVLYSQAVKSSVPVVILPTDVPGRDGLVESETPCRVDRDLCSASRCSTCYAMAVCPANAISVVEGSARIDLSKCVGCERCAKVCPIGAVKCWERVRLRPSRVDLDNIEKLRALPNTYVVNSVEELERVVESLLLRLKPP